MEETPEQLISSFKKRVNLRQIFIIFTFSVSYFLACKGYKEIIFVEILNKQFEIYKDGKSIGYSREELSRMLLTGVARKQRAWGDWYLELSHRLGEDRLLKALRDKRAVAHTQYCNILSKKIDSIPNFFNKRSLFNELHDINPGCWKSIVNLYLEELEKSREYISSKNKDNPYWLSVDALWYKRRERDITENDKVFSKLNLLMIILLRAKNSNNVANWTSSVERFFSYCPPERFLSFFRDNRILEHPKFPLWIEQALIVSPIRVLHLLNELRNNEHIKSSYNIWFSKGVERLGRVILLHRSEKLGLLQDIENLKMTSEEKYYSNLDRIKRRLARSVGWK